MFYSIYFFVQIVSSYTALFVSGNAHRKIRCIKNENKKDAHTNTLQTHSKLHMQSNID